MGAGAATKPAGAGTAAALPSGGLPSKLRPAMAPVHVLQQQQQQDCPAADDVELRHQASPEGTARLSIPDICAMSKQRLLEAAAAVAADRMAPLPSRVQLLAALRADEEAAGAAAAGGRLSLALVPARLPLATASAGERGCGRPAGQAQAQALGGAAGRAQPPPLLHELADYLAAAQGREQHVDADEEEVRGGGGAGWQVGEGLVGGRRGKGHGAG